MKGSHVDLMRRTACHMEILNLMVARFNGTLSLTEGARGKEEEKEGGKRASWFVWHVVDSCQLKVECCLIRVKCEEGCQRVKEEDCSVVRLVLPSPWSASHSGEVLGKVITIPYLIFQTPVSTRFLLGSTSKILEAEVIPHFFLCQVMTLTSVVFIYGFNSHPYRQTKLLGFLFLSVNQGSWGAGPPLPQFTCHERQK